MTTRTPDDGAGGSTRSAGAIVTEYLTAYFSGDIDRARSMVRGDFSFRAPLNETGGSKDLYFSGSDQKLSFVRDFRIIRQWEDGNEVSTAYEINVETPAGAGSMLMHEWHTVQDGQLASTVMVFDTSGRAAQLLRDALMSSH